jgi:hypothetical protein
MKYLILAVAVTIVVPKGPPIHIPAPKSAAVTHFHHFAFWDLWFGDWDL